ncbi:hypothetical protein LguiA_015840 [Lonicera macranthoides]
MISLCLTTPLSSSTPFSFLPNLKPTTILATYHHHHHHHRKKNLKQRSARNLTCRAELSQDAPFAVAIGSCILNSLVFPVPSAPHDDDDVNSLIDSSDARLAVMGIISFIPFFNWLSWVFAYLDTGKQRYIVYALVYLAPYVRYNLSLSPEESWLPIASILLCIIHIQLEASVKNGDLQGFQLFSKVEQQLPKKKDITISREERRKDKKNLPFAQEESRNEIGGWGVPRKPPQDPQHLENEDGEETNEEEKY